MKFKVSGQERHYPTIFWDNLVGKKPAEDFESNGCSWSPDYIKHYYLWPACHIHDWHYDKAAPLGGTWKARKRADLILRQNLRIVLKQQGAGVLLQWAVPYFYWGRVRIHGSTAYKGWEDGAEPLGVVQRLCEGWLGRLHPNGRM